MPPLLQAILGFALPLLLLYLLSKFIGWWAFPVLIIAVFILESAISGRRKPRPEKQSNNAEEGSDTPVE